MQVAPQPRNASLAPAVAEAEERYVARTPASRARWQAAAAAMPGGNTRTVLHFSPYPLVIARGEGQRITDADGQSYTDFLGEFTAGLYGHSNPTIMAAIRSALDDGIVLGGPNLHEAELANLITRRFPSLDLLRFCNSGTEANLLALMTARAHTGRNKVMVFRGGYHGGVFLFPAKLPEITAPFDWIVASYNDADAATRLIRENADDLAAVLLEPMMGNGGGIPGDPAFLQALRDESARAGTLLIFDEVMTSRLSPSGLQGKLGITPDMTTLGKYLGGGLSFGAFGGRDEIMARFDPTRPGALPHAGTFNNNVLSMIAGATGLREVLTDDALTALNARGDRLREGICAVGERHGSSLMALGVGSIMNLHFHRGPVRCPEDLWPAEAEAAMAADRLKLLHLDLLERGYYIARRGLLAPSLPMTEADIDGFLDALDEILTVRGDVLG